jgi:mercuric ion transport protein
MVIVKPALSTLGALGAAIASSLCCTGPLLYVGLGVGGAGLAGTFEPLRAWFLGGTALFLAAGFYGTYGRRFQCAADEKAERKRGRQKIMLWVGTAFVVFFATFPTWSTWLL